MEIELTPIKIKDLFSGYTDSGDEGVVSYDGKLDIRPAYQREYVYGIEQSEEVIQTILKGFPLNIMYWVKNAENQFEILDGQQRTLSICKYLNHDYDIKVDGKRFYWDSLSDEDYQKIINYELMVYICEGSPKEKLGWFEIVNVSGEELTAQELKNATYTGSWLASAKKHFSKKNCAAYGLSKKYVKGDPNRQELLEKALKWIAKAQDTSIDSYMSNHQHDENALELWNYFESVIEWVISVFPTYRKEMKGLDWGGFYNKFSNNDYDSDEFDKKITNLMKDIDVIKKTGIYLYLLSGEERYLSIRVFDLRTKRTAYELQNGICVTCQDPFDIEDMQADHITPWSKGGKTTHDNCQVLCDGCNRIKSNK